MTMALSPRDLRNSTCCLKTSMGRNWANRSLEDLCCIPVSCLSGIGTIQFEGKIVTISVIVSEDQACIIPYHPRVVLGWYHSDRVALQSL